MAEYINKDDVVRIITKLNQEPQYQHTDEDFFCGVATVFDGISDLPTIDAVPVVRCKDCLHWESGENDCEKWEYCWFFHAGIGPHSFCSYGRRKDGEE